MSYRIKPVDPTRNLFIKTNAGAEYITFASGSTPYQILVSKAVYDTIDQNVEALQAAGVLSVSIVSDFTPLKDPVRLVATGNITLANLQTIDSVAAVVGDRVLAAAQTDAEDSGIYDVASGAAWARSGDFAESYQVQGSVMIPVSEGTTNHDSIWILTTNDPIVLGTTDLTFEQYATL